MEYKVGTDFCIPPDYRGVVAILCQSLTFPIPDHSWSLDHKQLYSRHNVSAHGPNLTLGEYYLSSEYLWAPELFPNEFGPGALHVTGTGTIILDFHQLIYQQERQDVDNAILVDWTCELNNVHGRDSATSTINDCPKG